MSKEKNSHSGSGAVVAGILGMAAAAVAGAYFIYGDKDQTKKRIKHIRGWAVKAKGEVLEKVEKLKDVNEDKYNEVIDSIMKRYEKLKDVNVGEVVAMGKELKSHWKNIKKEMAQSTTSVKKHAKKAAKKTRNEVVSPKKD